MSVRQRVLHSVPLIAFALAIVFLGLSLGGYDPADPPGHGADPVNQPPRNPCGPVGAAFAHVLFSTLGWSSWLLLLGLAVVNLLVATRRPVPDKFGPAIGFGLVLVAASGFIHKIAPVLDPSPAVGSGGYVGALAAIFLEVHFGPVGMRLILGAAGMFGLALCHDVVFLWPIQEVRGWLRYQWWRGRQIHTAAPVASGSLAVRQDLADWESVSGIPANAVAKSVSMHPPIPVMTAGDASIPRLPTAAITHQRIPGPPADRANLVPLQPGSPFELPPMELLEPPTAFPIQEHEAKVHARAMLLERTLLDFGYQVRVVQIDTGPVITQFEIELEAGLRVSRIMSLADDLAIALAVPSVRIVAPIPGKTTVGIEVPNDHRAVVRLGDVIAGVGGRTQKCRIPLFLGKDVKGQPMVFDLAEMPHLLMAGRTGTGKSVCLNAMILSILMTKRPDEVKMILIDPKKVELSQYKRIPHLMHPVVTDMKKAESILSWACDKMEERYEFLRRAEVRNIDNYNSPGRRRDLCTAPTRGRRGTQANSDLHAVHRNHHRRTGRGDDDGGERGRATYCSSCSACPCGWHAFDPRHAEADRGCRHRPHQGKHARADRLSGHEP